jgi:hypothetical protein
VDKERLLAVLSERTPQELQRLAHCTAEPIARVLFAANPFSDTHSNIPQQTFQNTCRSNHIRRTSQYFEIIDSRYGELKFSFLQ